MQKVVTYGAKIFLLIKLLKEQWNFVTVVSDFTYSNRLDIYLLL